MSNQKKFFLVFIFIVLDIFLLVGFLVIRDKTFEYTLKKEISSLSELDITKDRYNTKIKTRGNYAVIEKAIKEYLDDYAVNLQNVLSILNDTKFKELLLVDNYGDDLDFKGQFMYIEDTKKNFNERIDTLIEECDEDNIKKYIREKLADPYYIAMYEDLMLKDEVSDDVMQSKEILISNKERVNLIFDTSEQIFTFLKEHRDEWIVENKEIKFKTQSLLDQYNAYLEKVK